MSQSASTAHKSANPPSPYQKWWVLLAVSIASFLGCIDFTIVNTALPAIQQQLQVDFKDLQWVVNAFILALSSTLVLAGRLADIYGRLRVLTFGLILFGIASLVAGLTRDLSWLIAARVVQGIGCAVLYTASAAIVATVFAPSEQGKAFGILFGANGVGLALGPVAGGLITAAWGWQWIFLINIPFIVLSLGLSWHYVQESHAQQNQAGQQAGLDWLGAILLLIGLPSLILTIVQGDNWGWTSPAIIGSVALAIVSLTAFVITELKVSSPIIDLRLFSNRKFVVSAVASAGLAVFYCVAFFVMPLYLSVVRQEDLNTIGWLLLPTTLGVAVLSPVVGRIVDAKGPEFLLKSGFVLFAVSALIQTTFNAVTPVWLLLLSFTAFGIAWASILGPSTVQAIASVPPHASSVAVGTVSTLHNIGGSIGLAIGVLIYRHFSTEQLASSTNQSSATGWLQQAASNPEQAHGLLQQQLGAPTTLVQQWINQSFIAGYQAVMWYLLATVLVSLAVIFYALRKSASSPAAVANASANHHA